MEANGHVLALVTLLTIGETGLDRKLEGLHSRYGRSDSPSCYWKQRQSFHLQHSHCTD